MSRLTASAILNRSEKRIGFFTLIPIHYRKSARIRELSTRLRLIEISDLDIIQRISKDKDRLESNQLFFIRHD